MSRSRRRPRRSTRLVARNARYDYSQRRTQERQRYDVREYELVDAAWWGWGLDPCMRRRTWTKRLRRKVSELLARYCGRCGVLKRTGIATGTVWCRCQIYISYGDRPRAVASMLRWLGID